MRINALEDQETGFQCGDADDNDEGRYILFYFLFAKNAWSLMKRSDLYEKKVNKNSGRRAEIMLCSKSLSYDGI